LKRSALATSPRPAASATTTAQAVAEFADTAAFSIVLLAAVAVPLVFSISQSDVFAQPKTALTVALAVVLAVLMAARWPAHGRLLQIPRSSLAAALVFFVVWNLLAWWFALDRAHAMIGERLQYQGLAAILAYVVFMLAAWTTVRSRRRQTLFLLSVAAGATPVAVYALVQRGGIDPIWPTLPHDRVFSSIGQANALAAYLVLAIPLVVALVRRGRASQLAVAAVVGIMLLALAFTLSRGGYLGAATTVALMTTAIVLWRPQLVTRRAVGTAAFIGLALLAWILVVPDARAVAERVIARALLTAELSEGSTRMKLDLWAVAIAISADHPLVGVGQDSYVLVFDDYPNQVLSPERAAVLAEWRPESPHNVYLALADGAGLPALAAYLAIIAAVAGRLVRALRTTHEPYGWLIAAALLAAIAGHLVTDLFMTAETTGSVSFWTLLGTGAAVSAASRRIDLSFTT
jgi:O-antigen ligase